MHPKYWLRSLESAKMVYGIKYVVQPFLKLSFYLYVVYGTNYHFLFYIKVIILIFP